MRKVFLSFLPFLLFIATAFIACGEVEEVGKYDNWAERNVAYIDSIKALTGENYVATADAADAMVLGKLYAIQVPSASTTNTRQYVYCKKLVANRVGERPLYTGYHSTVSAFYRGTYIDGETFDSNFDGYGALDQDIPLSDLRTPSVSDQPATFSVTGVIAGWTWALQYMRMGERWMLYIPYQCGYGASDYTPTGSSTTILGGSVLVFDLLLDSFAD